MVRFTRWSMGALVAMVLWLGSVSAAGAATASRPAAAASSGATVPTSRIAVGRPAAARGAVTTIVAQVFAALAESAGKSLSQVIAQNEPALGWLLPASVQRELLHAQQLEAVNQSIVSLGNQVKELQHQVALDGFTNLVAHTSSTITDIETAYKDLRGLAALPANSPDAAVDAAGLETYIKNHLLTAPERLNGWLAPKIPLASNLLESASRLVMQRDRFFGPRSSADVMDVYSAYAAYQTQLAVLLQNYYHAKPTEFSPTKARTRLADLRANVEDQKQSLKPPVPDDTVIDTKTHEMWTTNFPTGPQAPALEVPMGTIATLKTTYHPAFKYHYTLLKAAGPTALGGLPYDNWRLPDLHRFKGLISGRAGDSPVDWLQKQAGFNRAFLESGDALKWTDDTPHVFSPPIVPISSMDVRRFSLRTGEIQSLPVTWATQFGGWEHWFRREKAGRVYYRTIPDSEKYKYWW